MTLGYETPRIGLNTTHDYVYSSLLSVVAFFFLIAMATLVMLAQPPSPPEPLRGVELLPLLVEAFYFLAIVVVLVIRIFFPASRRRPTFALNIILLPLLPFGTILAIYGLAKADLRLRGNRAQLPSAIP